jgi:hypothetical protein
MGKMKKNKEINTVLNRCDIYLALIHHPILNKEGKVITTSVTNFDLHDLARTGKTFGVKKVFIVTPLPAQREMIRYIKTYWREGTGAKYNPDRSEAFDIIEPSPSIEDTCLTIQNLSGSAPHLVATTAKRCEKSVGYSVFQKTLPGEKPVLIAFGTGFGLTNEFLQSADTVLDPIRGTGDYNHLPVRSAVAIVLDRLMQGKPPSSA